MKETVGASILPPDHYNSYAFFTQGLCGAQVERAMNSGNIWELERALAVLRTGEVGCVRGAEALPQVNLNKSILTVSFDPQSAWASLDSAALHARAFPYLPPPRREASLPSLALRTAPPPSALPRSGNSLAVSAATPYSISIGGRTPAERADGLRNDALTNEIQAATISSVLQQAPTASAVTAPVAASLGSSHAAAPKAHVQVSERCDSPVPSSTNIVPVAAAVTFSSSIASDQLHQLATTAVVHVRRSRSQSSLLSTALRGGMLADAIGDTGDGASVTTSDTLLLPSTAAASAAAASAAAVAAASIAAFPVTIILPNKTAIRVLAADSATVADVTADALRQLREGVATRVPLPASRRRRAAPPQSTESSVSLLSMIAADASAGGGGGSGSAVGGGGGGIGGVGGPLAIPALPALAGGSAAWQLLLHDDSGEPDEDFRVLDSMPLRGIGGKEFVLRARPSSAALSLHLPLPHPSVVSQAPAVAAMAPAPALPPANVPAAQQPDAATSLGSTASRASRFSLSTTSASVQPVPLPQLPVAELDAPPPHPQTLLPAVVPSDVPAVAPPALPARTGRRLTPMSSLQLAGVVESATSPASPPAMSPPRLAAESDMPPVGGVLGTGDAGFSMAAPTAAAAADAYATLLPPQLPPLLPLPPPPPPLPPPTDFPAQEWPVVKTNRAGWRQQRIFSVDRGGVSSSLAAAGGLFAGPKLRVRRALADIDRAEALGERSFVLFFSEAGAGAPASVMRCEARTADERDDLLRALARALDLDGSGGKVIGADGSALVA